MRRDVQEIFKMTPHEKQVLMFSATLNKEIRPVCKKFMQDVCLINENIFINNRKTKQIQYYFIVNFSQWKFILMMRRN